jgi:lactoylglutathione lyase
MAYKYEFTRLLVSNFKACFRFYRDVMGFQSGYGTENDTYADFSTGTVCIALFDKQEMSATVGTSRLPADAPVQDKVCLVFIVDEVDEACRQLKAKGIALVTEPADHAAWGIRTAHFRDPDGNLIEINQALPR